jgi:TM2 domain-containing membrane protein YozV
MDNSIEKKKVSWLPVLIVSILVGSFGIDRFMMGHVGLGIVKLLTFGGLGIWYLVDLIMIAMKSDFPGVEWEY